MSANEWTAFDKGPAERGDYSIRVVSRDGRTRELKAWHNPSTKHWMIDGKEVGYMNIIALPDEPKEWQIVHYKKDV